MKYEGSENLQTILKEKLPGSVVDFLLGLGKIASQMGMTAYAVGGFVRDLLLGTPTLDIDIVVEGDGIALAKKIAEMWRLKLTIHERFLTATLRRELERGVMQSRRALQRFPIDSENTHVPEPVLPFTISRIDIATARKERYPQPAALPEVEPATISDDLLRRDFTINAMAICLAPGRFGELVDPNGGSGDLRKGIVRVLHERSFIDDPTRIFRAVRYEQRFGFKIEPQTLSLICQARDESLLTKLTRDRIKHEIWRILRENDPVKPMKRLRDLSVLSIVAPELSADAKRLKWMQRTIEWLNWFSERFPEKRLEREWALLLPLLPSVEAVDSFSRRYQLGEHEKECALAMLRESKRRAPKRPSSWVRWLNPLPLEAALVLAAKEASTNDPIRRRYFLEWRWARPDITGEDLKALGITGRAISIGLQSALVAKLDKGADTNEQLKIALKEAKRAATSGR